MFPENELSKYNSIVVVIIWHGFIFTTFTVYLKQCKDALADGKFNDRVQLLIGAIVYKL
jgi:hypothetical protein